MELAFEIIKWLCVAIAGTMLLLMITTTMICIFTDRKWLWAIHVVILFLFLCSPVFLVKDAGERKPQRQCPDCKKAVVISYCPDCGWTAHSELPELVCATLGAD